MTTRLSAKEVIRTVFVFSVFFELRVTSLPTRVMW